MTSRPPSAEFRSTSFPRRDASSVTVLLIEDNPGDARLFGELLAESDLEASDRWESSFEDGLRAAVEEDPTVIVVDLGLPDSQGIDTVARMASRLPDTPLVVLTGQAGTDTAAAALAECYVRGVSTWRVAEICEVLFDGRVSHDTVRRRRSETVDDRILSCSACGSWDTCGKTGGSPA